MQPLPMLLPLVIGASFAFLASVDKRGKKLSPNDIGAKEYRFGTGIRWFLSAGTIVCFFAPGVATLYGAKPPLFAWITFSGVFTLFLCVCDLYAIRYFVRLSASEVVYGWLKTNSCFYKDVVSIRVLISNQGNSYLVIKKNDGSTIKFDGNLQQFNDLYETLKTLVISANPAATIG